MRYELQNDELAVIFTKDEINVALAYENAMHGARGASAGELMYACLVDAINEKTGVPASDWRAGPARADHPEHEYPESIDAMDGVLVIKTLRGESVALPTGA